VEGEQECKGGTNEQRAYRHVWGEKIREGSNSGNFILERLGRGKTAGTASSHSQDGKGRPKGEETTVARVIRRGSGVQQIPKSKNIEGRSVRGNRPWPRKYAEQRNKKMARLAGKGKNDQGRRDQPRRRIVNGTVHTRMKKRKKSVRDQTITAWEKRKTRRPVIKGTKQR